MQKKYYKIEFCLKEPLSLGNGENQYSDSDLLRDSMNRPFIPASSLCGCYRSILGEKLAQKYFGRMESDGSTTESSVVVYDATLKGKYRTSVRDSVGLDEFKTGITGAKFDFEMIEPGAVFVTYLEQTFESNTTGNKDTESEITREKRWMLKRISVPLLQKLIGTDKSAWDEKPCVGMEMLKQFAKKKMMRNAIAYMTKSFI